MPFIAPLIPAVTGAIGIADAASGGEEDNRALPDEDGRIQGQPGYKGGKPVGTRSFSEKSSYDPNKFEYGGRPGGADEAAGRFQQGEAGYMRNAGDLMSQAHEDRTLGLQARGQQQQAANLMINRAQGRDLVSDRMAQGARNDLTSRLQSSVASARGPAGLANAQSDAMAAGAQGLGQINQNATTAGMQEQAAAEGAAFGAASGMRGGDEASRQAGLGGSAQQGGLGVQYGGLHNQVRANQLQGGVAQQQTLSQSETARDQMNNAAAQASKGRDAALANQMISTGGSIVSGIAKMAADGGAISAGDKVLVGERGPEMVVNSAGGGFDPDKGSAKSMAMGGVQGAAESMGDFIRPPEYQSPNLDLRMPPAPKFDDKLPGRAKGGPVTGGKPYIVGENGPEIITPKQDSFVIPNHMLRRESGGQVPAGRSALVGEVGREAVVDSRSLREKLLEGNTENQVIRDTGVSGNANWQAGDAGMNFLWAPKNQTLQQDWNGKSSLKKVELDDDKRPRLSKEGDAKADQEAVQEQMKTRVPIPVPRRQLTPEELIKMADELDAQQREQHEMRMYAGPSVRDAAPPMSFEEKYTPMRQPMADEDPYMLRREGGGPIPAGRKTLVGEKGPETVLSQAEQDTKDMEAFFGKDAQVEKFDKPTAESKRAAAEENRRGEELQLRSQADALARQKAENEAELKAQRDAEPALTKGARKIVETLGGGARTPEEVAARREKTKAGVASVRDWAGGLADKYTPQWAHDAVGPMREGLGQPKRRDPVSFEREGIQVRRGG